MYVQYVCMYVCMYVYMYVCMYVCMTCTASLHYYAYRHAHNTVPHTSLPRTHCIYLPTSFGAALFSKQMVRLLESWAG